jgi:hypothetical protein
LAPIGRIIAVHCSSLVCHAPPRANNVPRCTVKRSETRFRRTK